MLPSAPARRVVRDVALLRPGNPERGSPATGGNFADIYEAHFAFVWRSLRRLGVDTSMLDDAAQDVFLVVHRKLPDFEWRSSVKTWIYGIVRRVAGDHRKAHRRRATREGTDGQARDPDATPDLAVLAPHESGTQTEAVRLVHELLDSLDDDKREVFVLTELEQMTAVEIAETTGVTLNTVYSRLRAARRDFQRAAARMRARRAWRSE